MVERGSQRAGSSSSSPMRTDEEVIMETSLESFPASDPPAWVFGRDQAPAPEVGDFCSWRSKIERVPAHILEKALTVLRHIRSSDRDNAHP